MKIVELRNITKRFGGILANDDISLDVENNTVHCIIGENGAGKSTLMKILFGIHRPDKGEIYIKGNKVSFKSSLDAIKLKIGMLHQHFMLIEDFTVLENVILGAEITEGYKIDFKKAKDIVNNLIEKYNLQLNPDNFIYELSISEKQKVELLKLLYRNSDILILDEPTAVLSPIELKEFYKILDNFKHEGKTIILITHKLSEVKEVSDKVSVLRKGRPVFEADKDNIDISVLSRKMIGDVDDIYLVEKIDQKILSPTTVLRARNLHLEENGILKLNNINFELKTHNILGICGVEGNGQNEIIDVLLGFKKKYKGEVYPKGLSVSIVPDDRSKKGMIGEMSMAENYFIREKKRKFASKKFLEEQEVTFKKMFDISLAYMGCKMKYLSGGNQQKAIVGREILLGNKVLIFSQPTRGVDILARERIHSDIIKERDREKAILLISSDLDELLSLSDELAVIFKGTFLKVFQYSELKNELELNKTLFLENIGKLMMGLVN